MDDIVDALDSFIVCSVGGDVGHVDELNVVQVRLKRRRGLELLCLLKLSQGDASFEPMLECEDECNESLGGQLRR